jgi:hypothetical protein
MLSAVQLQGE